jgi:hypothetical protein
MKVLGFRVESFGCRSKVQNGACRAQGLVRFRVQM